MYKLMIIEDDIMLCSMIKEHLERYGYSIYIVENFNDMENEIFRAKPDLLILDINLPYYDGFYICKAVRKNSSIPIIITSARSETMDQVLAIELGADDYVTKPINLDIFMVKMKAVLRRTYGEYSSANSNNSVGYLNLDAGNFQLSYKNKLVALTKNEYKLIKLLIDNKDRITTREEIFEALWDTESFVDENTLTVNMTRLKNKLSEAGINNIIKTKRGVGYIFDYSVLKGEENEQ
ncbi:response regulator transcription factor [Clostridium folliculivorans]|uniref:response regulator transcription factor n=1 Tax=Clostridium folliculivorans TaxID=2886038 RepID=UPI0021C268A5|nr:response regulator transcription factor [Clostridium folliculivorans]GKU28351.1 transcriptional regulator [Clostridium folliculivorans]